MAGSACGHDKSGREETVCHTLQDRGTTGIPDLPCRLCATEGPDSGQGRNVLSLREVRELSCPADTRLFRARKIGHSCRFLPPGAAGARTQPYLYRVGTKSAWTDGGVACSGMYSRNAASRPTLSASPTGRQANRATTARRCPHGPCRIPDRLSPESRLSVPESSGHSPCRRTAA